MHLQQLADPLLPLCEMHAASIARMPLGGGRAQWKLCALGPRSPRTHAEGAASTQPLDSECPRWTTPTPPVAQVYSFNVPTFGPGVVYDVDQKVRTEQFRWFTEALKKERLKAYVPQFVMEAEVGAWGWAGPVPRRVRAGGRALDQHMLTAARDRSAPCYPSHVHFLTLALTQRAHAPRHAATFCRVGGGGRGGLQGRVQPAHHKDSCQDAARCGACGWAGGAAPGAGRAPAGRGWCAVHLTPCGHLAVRGAGTPRPRRQAGLAHPGGAQCSSGQGAGSAKEAMRWC